MSIVSWLADEPWSDHPECSHHLLTRWGIAAHDSDCRTVEERSRLVADTAERLLGTWWIPDTVCVWAWAETADIPQGDGVRFREVLALIETWNEYGRRRPNLADARLTRADLTRANLVGADLAGADLTDANLTDANLAGARLTRAYLGGANLTGADRGASPAPAGWVKDADNRLVRA